MDHGNQRLACIQHVKVARGLAPDRSPRVKDQAPRILLHQTIMIYFETLGFGSFSFSPLAFIRSVFSRSPPIVVACPSKSNGSFLSLLRRGFPSHFPLEYFLPELQIRRHASSGMDGQYSLRESGLQEFQLPRSRFPPK
jgi:hypothetical protein